MYSIYLFALVFIHPTFIKCQTSTTAFSANLIPTQEPGETVPKGLMNCAAAADPNDASKIYIVGGEPRHQEITVSDEIWTYDYASKLFEKLNPTRVNVSSNVWTGRSRADAVFLAPELWIFGGTTNSRTSNGNSNQVFKLDTTTNTIAFVPTTGDIPRGWGHSVAFIDPLFYAFGYTSGNTSLSVFDTNNCTRVTGTSSIYRLNKDTLTWDIVQAENDGPTPRFWSKMVANQNSLYIVGGTSNLCTRAHTNEVWTFDTISNQWTLISPPTGTFELFTAPRVGIYNNFIYIYSGVIPAYRVNIFAAANFQSRMWIYSISSNSWSYQTFDTKSIAGYSCSGYGIFINETATKFILISFGGINGTTSEVTNSVLELTEASSSLISSLLNSPLGYALFAVAAFVGVFIIILIIYRLTKKSDDDDGGKGSQNIQGNPPEPDFQQPAYDDPSGAANYFQQLQMQGEQPQAGGFDNMGQQMYGQDPGNPYGGDGNPGNPYGGGTPGNYYNGNQQNVAAGNEIAKSNNYGSQDNVPNENYGQTDPYKYPTDPYAAPTSSKSNESQSAAQQVYVAEKSVPGLSFMYKPPDTNQNTKENSESSDLDYSYLLSSKIDSSAFTVQSEVAKSWSGNIYSGTLDKSILSEETRLLFAGESDQVNIKVWNVSKSFPSGVSEELLHRELTVLHHMRGTPNVLQFIGYSDDVPPTKIIVLMFHSTLYEELHNPDESKWDVMEMKRTVAVALATAIGYLHSVGFVHNRLNPKSVLLKYEDSNSEPLPLLSDFGSTLSFSDDPTLYKINNGSFIAMQIRYTAPEILKNIRSTLMDMMNICSASSDIFSYGMILYEVITRASPFQGEDEQSTRVMISGGQVPPVSPEDEQQFPVLVSVMNQCLQYDPMTRPDSFTTIWTDLNQ